jgi:hypothetical protein
VGGGGAIARALMARGVAEVPSRNVSRCQGTSDGVQAEESFTWIVATTPVLSTCETKSIVSIASKEQFNSNDELLNR